MDYKHSCVIDAQGLYKTLVLVLMVNTETGIDEKPQYYTLKSGERLVDATPPIMRPYAGADGFVSPKWGGYDTSWTEAATEEEITAWEAEHPAPVLPEPPPTEQEQMRADIDFLAAMTGVSL